MQRDASLDIAKGIAIVAIVFGHVWRGLATIGLLDEHGALFIGVDTSVYMFHLSVFALVAGLFVQRGMRRDGPGRYAAIRDLGFLWVYLIWTLIIGASKLALSGTVNSQVSVGRILEIWRPLDQLWFFGWIAIMMLFVAVAQPWRSTPRAVIVVLISAGWSVYAWGVNGAFIGTQGFGLTFFFTVGVLIQSGPVLVALRRSIVVQLGVFVGAAAVMLALAWPALATPPTQDGGSRTALSVVLGVVASVAGVVAILALSGALAKAGPAASWLAVCGRRSMDIFVAHVIFLAGARVVLTRIGIDSIPVHVIVGTAAGVVGALLLGAIARRIRCGWLFDAPAWLTARLTAADRTAGSHRAPAR